MKELADDGIPVAVTCRVLKLARQPYYRWLANPVTDAGLVEAYRANALFDAHRDDPEFGYRFLVAEAGDAGQPMAERTAWRICSNNGWWSVFGKRKRGKNGKVGPPVHDDLVGRDFTADSPNRLWLADITEHRSFRVATDMRVYFCDPGAPWQRGTNENTNGLLRQYFPKGTDLSRHSIADLQAVAEQLNTRPRKTLGWDTPAERLTDLLEHA